MPQVEAWKTVLVSNDFVESQHGKLGCIACHKGDPGATDKNAAHENLVASPGSEPEQFCAGCHGSVTANHVHSIHKNLAGYHRRIELRLGYSIKENQDLMNNFNQECGKCHASCGQCHVSRPTFVYGGFVSGHNFLSTPDMTNSCTACHCSRVGAEFLGQNQGFEADLHQVSTGTGCEFCHNAEEMHGIGATFDYRYNVTNAPKCENCHQNKAKVNKYHIMHWSSTFVPKLSCHVCHSQEYKNCTGCHTGSDGIGEPSYMTFKIGKNYLKSGSRDYDYTTVRHIPIVPTTYANWGIANLPNFNAEPTWKYATPHNILRWTPRTQVNEAESCATNCHHSDYYLTEADLEEFEKEANKDVIIIK